MSSSRDPHNVHAAAGVSTKTPLLNSNLRATPIASELRPCPDSEGKNRNQVVWPRFPGGFAGEKFRAEAPEAPVGSLNRPPGEKPSHQSFRKGTLYNTFVLYATTKVQLRLLAWNLILCRMKAFEVFVAFIVITATVLALA